MTSARIVIAACLVVGLLFAATVNITLRQLSRVRLGEILRRKGRGEMLDKLVAVEGELAMSMAVVRTTFSLALVLMVLKMMAEPGVHVETRVYLGAFLATLALVIVFGVAIPAAWAKYAGESLLAVMLPPSLLLLRLFYPLTKLLGPLDSLVRRLAGVPKDEDGRDVERHERELLDAVSEGELVGAVDEEEKEMIESVIDLRDTDATEIMTPRTEIGAVDKTASLAEVKQLIREVGHSRIPVFEETIDNVIGVLYAKDLLHVDDSKPFSVTDCMRPAHYIPETKNLRDLLHEFQAKKVHMAIILDEYGGTAGLVTIEDILEELVGEIADEYDQDEPEPLVRIDENTVDADARLSVDEINEELDIELPDEEDYETLGGFVAKTLGRIPEAGEVCIHENVRVEVIDAEPRRINRLRIHVDRNHKPEE